ncbi:hypothetical protein FO470_04945 [Starkeya sp. 3C]|uniref:Uncharacterized protein n=1 Tax=Ancylobacter moscoviensis TaxID=2597768 RepID=A0ABY3DWQ8_9HYPH|nr:hypothetical protein [Ancylobacter moscoviensis]TSJ64609.1 hypothetical protein FO470_04945 [Ancylobacter moscoviensis]
MVGEARRLPRRVQLGKSGERTLVPAGAVRVDRATRWRPPFWTDHHYVDLVLRGRQWVDDRQHRLAMLAEAYRDWLMGGLTSKVSWWCYTPDALQRALPAPPAIEEIEYRLRGRNLADWPPLGWPCAGDVLLSIANRQPDGSLFPTPSDAFKPRLRPITSDQRRKENYWISKFGR